MSLIRRTLVTAAAAAFFPIAASAQAAPDESPRLYVANQGDAEIVVVDIGSLEIVETVDLQALGFTENAKPHHIVVEPDGSHWYVSLIGENRVLRFDRDNELVGQATFEVPGMLALHPDGEHLYVGRSMSAVNPPSRIGIVELEDMAVDEIDVFFARPHAISIHPSGDHVYSASLAVNQIGAVDATSWDMELVELDGPTHALVQFAISPDGGTLVATGELTGQMLVFDLADPANPVLTKRIDVGPRPWHPVYGPDGRFAYVGLKGSNEIKAIDVEAGTVAWTVAGHGIDQPHGSALSPDGRLLFVSNNGPGGMGMAMGGEEHAGREAGGGHGAHHAEGEATAYEAGTVAVIDTESGELVQMIPVGRNATGIGAPGVR